MMLADSFKRKNADGERVEIEDGYRDAVYNVIKVNPSLSIVEPMADTQALMENYSSKLEKFSSKGRSTVSAEPHLDRLPAQRKRKRRDPSKPSKNSA